MESSALHSTVSDTTSHLNTSQEVVEAVQQLGEDTQDFFTNTWNFIQDSLPTIIQVVLVALIGLLLAKIILRLCRKGLQRSKMDKSAHHFFYSVVRGVVYIVLVLVILQTMGVEMSSIVALFSVCGVALSLAVQDSLSNVCGGVLLLISKPLELGDYVLINGVEGEVVKISLLNIKLHTVDNKAIYIPNGVVTQNTIINYSKETTRQLDLDIPIGYDDDFHKAEEIIRKTVLANPKTIPEPAPLIRIMNYGDSAILIKLRVWVSKDDLWELRYDVLEQIKDAFDREGISIPYQQVDVRMVTPSSPKVPPAKPEE